MIDLKPTEHFTVEEIIKSKTAEENGIDNFPKTDEICENINYTLTRLEEIRQKYGKPIYITSGYRCEELNRKVGGVRGSKHQKGLAADLRMTDNLADFLKWNKMYDKMIFEKSKTANWIHLQFLRNRNDETGKIIYMTV